MVYRLLGWGVVGIAYHKIKDADVLYASAKILFNNRISAYIKNISIFSEAGFRTTLALP